MRRRRVIFNRNRAALCAPVACAALSLASAAQAMPVAHCSLEGNARIASGTLFSEGTASCAGVLAQAIVVPSDLGYTLRGSVRGLGSVCSPLGALTGELVFHARKIVSLMEPSIVTARAGVAIAGGASGALAGSGDDGVDGIALAGAAAIVGDPACGTGVLRMTFEVVADSRPPASSSPEPEPQAEGTPPPAATKSTPPRAAKRTRRKSRRAARCHRARNARPAVKKRRCRAVARRDNRRSRKS